MVVWSPSIKYAERESLSFGLINEIKLMELFWVKLRALILI